MISERAQPRPTGAPEQERPQVLHDLDPLEPRPRHPSLDDPSTLDRAAVDGADRTAGRDDAGRVVDERLDDAEQCFLVEDGVGVDEADERMPGRVEPDVRGVAAAADAVLADDQEGCAARRGVDTFARRRASGRRREHAGDLGQLERLAEHVEGRVDDPSSTTITSSFGYRNARSARDGFDDSRLFVARRDHDRHRGRQRAGEDVLVACVRQRPEVRDRVERPRSRSGRGTSC